MSETELINDVEPIILVKQLGISLLQIMFTLCGVTSLIGKFKLASRF